MFPIPAVPRCGNIWGEVYQIVKEIATHLYDFNHMDRESFQIYFSVYADLSSTCRHFYFTEIWHFGRFLTECRSIAVWMKTNSISSPKRTAVSKLSCFLCILLKYKGEWFIRSNVQLVDFILIFALILSLTHFSSFLTLTQTEAPCECVKKGGIGSKAPPSALMKRHIMIMVLQLPRLRLTKRPATESSPAVHITDRVSGSGWRSAQRRSLKRIRRFLSKIFKIDVLLWVYVLKKSMCDLPNNRWSCSSGESGKESGTGGCSFDSTSIHQSYFEIYYFDNCEKNAFMPSVDH